MTEAEGKQRKKKREPIRTKFKKIKTEDPRKMPEPKKRKNKGREDATLFSVSKAH